MITFPAMLLGLLIACLIGALYHLVRDGGPGQLLLYILLSILGFVAGHMVGVWQGWVLLPLGMLNLGMSVPGSLLFMAAGDWFTHAGRADS